MTTFVAGLGNDTFTGSADTSDTVDYSDPSATDAGILVYLQYDPTYVGRGEGSDELISIENIIGTAFNDTVFATNGGVHTLSLGGGNDEFLTNGSGLWTLDGGDGNDFWAAEYISETQNLVLTYDTATGSGSLTGGTTFSHVERLGVTLGKGNDTVVITGKLTGYNSMGTVLQTYDGDDTLTLGGFSGLNHRLSAGRGYDTLNLTLSDDMNASTSIFTIQDNIIGFDIVASTGALNGESFEAINYTLDNGDNRVVFNGLAGAVHVDARDGTDGLEIDIASTDRLVNNVNWTITGSVTTASNIGSYDHFETVKLRLGGGTNVLHMGDEADDISSTAGLDTIFGGGGSDNLHADFFLSPARVVTYHGGDDNDALTGGALNDRLYGDAGNDVATGGGGNDTLDGGTGDDTMIGGAGNDTYHVDSTGDVITELTSQGKDLVYSSISYTLGANVDWLELDDDAGNIDGTGGKGNDSIYGNAGDNVLMGGAGNDFLGGRANYVGSTVWTSDAGNDTIHGGDGNDAVDGGGTAGHLAALYGDAGNDIVGTGGYADVDGGAGTDQLQLSAFEYSRETGLAVTVDLSGVPEGAVAYTPGGGSIRGFEVFYLFGASFSDILISGSGADTIQGWDGNDRLEGRDGNDNLDGGFGNDTLDGGSGSDTMTGGAGDDIFMVDSLLDVVIENVGGGVDTVRTAVTMTLSANLENLVLTGEAAMNGTGNAAANLLTGNGADNLLIGLDGNDALTGDNGADTLTGGVGNDTLDGGLGNDLLSDNGGTNQLHGGDGDDVLVFDTSGHGNIFDGGDGSDTLDLTSITADGVVVNLANGTYVDTIGSDTLLAIENVDGSGGNDVITGSDAANRLNGGLGEDSLYARGGNDTIHGNGGDDVIYGGDGVNSLYGNDGNDYIQTQASDSGSTNDGGDGRDTIDYSWKFGDHNVVIDLTAGTYSDDSGNGTVLNFESVLGTQGSETITGNGADNALYGYDGDDRLNGMDGNDTLAGGNGIDTIDAGGGNDTVDGGDGDDVIYSSGAGTYLGGAGNDYIRAGVSFGSGEELDGGLGDDTLDTTLSNVNYFVDLANGRAFGDDATEHFINFEHVITGSGDDDVAGTDSANRLLTGAGDDILRGYDGNDWLEGGTGADEMLGMRGDDTYIIDNVGDLAREVAAQGTDLVLASVSYSLGVAYIENLTLTGADNIDAKGNGLANVIFGNSGNNRLDGSGGADTLTGGLGDDTYIVDSAGDAVIEAVAEGIDTLQTAFTTTLTSTLENLILTGSTATNGTGNAANNRLTGSNGNNWLAGLGGDDVLTGGYGTDTLVGGLGNDTYVIDNAGDIFTELNNQGTDTLLSSVTIALTNSQSIETLTLTGPAHINASGNASANVLNGNSGNNILNGGSGADTMSGGAGHDIYVVENAGDIVTEALGAGTDTVQSAVTYVLGDNVENLTLAGSAAINGTGNALANTIYGNAGANFLTGGGGADKLYGRGGNDTYIVDNAAMGISELLGGVDAGGVDEVRASVSYSLKDYFENLVLTETGNINGVGNGLANHVTGNSGNNLLTGGGGNDTVLGGLGADQFVFGAGSGVDIVGDFSGLQNDRINVHALAHGVVNGGGVTFSQSGLDTIVNLGGGNMVTITGALVADVQSHMVW